MPSGWATGRSSEMGQKVAYVSQTKKTGLGSLGYAKLEQLIMWKLSRIVQKGYFSVPSFIDA